MFQYMQTYSKKKSRCVQESDSETANDVFPNSPVPKSPFSFTESSESEKENKETTHRKGTCTSARRNPQRKLKSCENLKTNQQYSMGRKYSLKSRSGEAFTKQSPLTKKNAGYQRKTQKSVNKSEKFSEKTQNKSNVEKNMSQNLENNSPPSIELPRKDVQVTWQEKISMLYPLMMDSNAKANPYDYKTQKGLPTLNVSHSSIEEVPDEEETEDGSGDDDDDDDESSVYRTTYTYTWVTDNDTQQAPVSKIERILPVPYEIEEVHIDEPMFKDEKKQHGQSREDINLLSPKNLDSDDAELPKDTMNFQMKNKSKILNSTVKNGAAQNIQQNLFPVDISTIYSENVDTFKVPPALTDKEFPNDTQDVDSEPKQRKAQVWTRQSDKNTLLMSEGNVSRDKQNSLLKSSSIAIGQSNEVLSKSGRSKKDNLLKDGGSIEFQKKKKSLILNSTVKNSAAKNIKQIVFPKDISSIIQNDTGNFKTLVPKKRDISNSDKPVKEVRSKAVVHKQKSKKSPTKGRKTLLSSRSVLLSPELTVPVSTTKSSQVFNDEPNKETRKKRKNLLNSTEIPDSISISAQLEKTPQKVPHCKASTPKKLKQMNKTENKQRKLQPKSSTMLFVSNHEGIGNVIPDMSTIWKDTLTNNNKTIESDHSTDTVVETEVAQGKLSNTHNEEQKEKKQQQHFKEIVTSTPSKSSSDNPQARRFELDISTVQEPSFDEDMLFVRNSTEVNSLEIAPYCSDDDNMILFKKKSDVTASNRCDNYYQHLPKQDYSERKSAVGQEGDVSKQDYPGRKSAVGQEGDVSGTKRKKRQGSILKQSQEISTEVHFPQVKQHVPSLDNNSLESITASDGFKVANDKSTINNGLDIKQISEEFTDQQKIEAVLHNSPTCSGNSSRKRKINKNVNKKRKIKKNAKRWNSASVPLCPLADLTIVPWPKFRAEVHVKVLKRKASVSSLQKLPEDVLFLLDKPFRKGHCSY